MSEGRLKPRQKLGKYIVEKVIGEGGFATVYRARDTIEDTKVALKIPHASFIGRNDQKSLEIFRKEVRLTAALDHPNILPIKNADFIDKHFVIVTPLAEQTLADRISTRLSIRTAIDYARQMLEGLAEAHNHRIIHCDIKPENMLLFSGNRLRITDFGIARVAQRTLQVSGSGTVGYMAPEQAMGKSSFASDVFSLGMVLWRLFSGKLPEWPMHDPLPGLDRLRQRVHKDMIAFLSKSIEIEPAHRYPDAEAMLRAFRRIKRVAGGTTRRRKKRDTGDGEELQQIRFRHFQRRHGTELGTRHECRHCGGPISESMRACPWCGTEQKKFKGETRMPARCPRCKRGMKLDWKFCAYCYGPAVGPRSTREYSDQKYTGRCSNKSCPRRELMPFMRYCPWCRRKVTQTWSISGTREKCPSCQQGVLSSYWHYCPWCKSSLS
ncbi:MAG: protein kinase [Leptospiraceae bacterium]|nr:protein kinase [Leptospiraceae bacterium]